MESSAIATFFVHPFEPQLTALVGAAAVHQARQGQEHGVGGSSRNLAHRHSDKTGNQGRLLLPFYLLPQTQLTATV